MERRIVNTEKNPAKVEERAYYGDIPVTLRENVTDLIDAVNYLLERDRKETP